MIINTDKAYILGLLIGGGIIQNRSLQIRLPYKKWGNVLNNPTRCGQISTDILTRIKPIMESVYSIQISYIVGTDWQLFSPNVSDLLIKDLTFLGLPTAGEFREYADLSSLIQMLDNSEKVRFFVAGLIDTIGSMAQSHRRYTEDFQVVSFEFKGKNFLLVKQIVEIFQKINCTPDQILWNHPNQHSGTDRYYKSWKKGFKVRVSLDDYINEASFFCKAKRESALENIQLEKNERTTYLKIPSLYLRNTLHVDENSTWLPSYLRGYHFIHNMHLAKFLGLDLIDNEILREWVRDSYKYVNPFTILTKGTTQEIEDIINNEIYLKKSRWKKIDLNTKDLISICQTDTGKLIYGKSESDGFPINYILQGISFIISASLNRNLFGKRVTGNYIDNIVENVPDYYKRKFIIDVYKPNKGTCLLIKSKLYGVLVGYVNNQFIKPLVTRDGDFGIKMINPDYSDCVSL